MDTKSAAYRNTQSSWWHMVQRCRGKNHKYQGVTVCERWGEFENFIADMGLRPSLAHSLDRYPNPAGSYEPSNCRWATMTEQNRNKTNHVYIEYEGACRLLVEVVEELGLSYPVVYGRLKNGWPAATALHKPLRKKRKHKNK